MSDERMERHSGDPKSSVKGNLKKMGGGGKYTLGRPEDQEETLKVDKGDPNYDSENEGPNIPKSQTTWFDQIVRGELAVASVYEDDQVLAVEEQNNPQAPVHILVFPKDRISKLKRAKEDQKELLGQMMLAVGKVCRQQQLSDYRLVVNDGSGAGQTVNYLHFHILAGRPMEWPPG
jgi:histidine triad (HIT) family protein